MTKEKNIVAVIPARLASSRFPRKPLAPILGIPMIGHCYLRTRMCRRLNGVYLATCDPEIADYIRRIGGEVVMTKNTHKRASDRTAEAVHKIERATKRKLDIVVMVQGDEPMVVPQMIEKALAPLLRDSSILVSNLMARIDTHEEHEDPNEVKVVVDCIRNALYFSREAIPSRKMGANEMPIFKQVCIIPFQRDFLFKYLKLRPTPLEMAESVDMNRILEHGYKVRMVEIERQTYAVDTPEDMKFVEQQMKTDPLVKRYIHWAAPGQDLRRGSFSFGSDAGRKIRKRYAADVREL